MVQYNIVKLAFWQKNYCSQLIRNYDYILHDINLENIIEFSGMKFSTCDKNITKSMLQNIFDNATKINFGNHGSIEYVWNFVKWNRNYYPFFLLEECLKRFNNYDFRFVKIRDSKLSVRGRYLFDNSYTRKELYKSIDILEYRKKELMERNVWIGYYDLFGKYSVEMNFK